MNEGIRLAYVTDGTGNTLCMGEGTGGGNWPLCRGAGCDVPFSGPHGRMEATGLWSLNGIGSVPSSGAGILTAGLWASTAELPNKWPMTDSWLDATNASDCRSTTDGGMHSAANFRSHHTGGIHFLMIDGSVRFVSDGIEMPTYRAMSTIANGEALTAQ